MRKSIFCACLFLLFPCRTAFAGEGTLTSEQVLRRCAAAYAGAERYYEQSSLTVGPEGRNQVVRRITVAAKRPATLKVTIRSDDEIILFYEGGWLHTHNATKQTYSKSKAESVGDLVEAAGALGCALPAVEAFFSEDPYATITEGVSRIRRLRTAVLDGTRMYRVDFEKPGRPASEGYFDTETCLLRALNVRVPVRGPRGPGFVTMQYRVARALLDEFPKDEAGKDLDVLAFKAPAGEEVSTAAQSGQKEPIQAASLIGKPAPEFALPDAAGKTVRLSSMKGKAVVLVFYRKWNPGVYATLFGFTNFPYLESNPELCWFAVHDEETTALMDGISEKHGIQIYSLYSGGTSVQDDYLIKEDPTTVFINKEGIIHDVMTRWTTDGVRQAVNQMCDRQYERTADR